MCAPQGILARPTLDVDGGALHASGDAVVEDSGEFDSRSYFRLHSFDEQVVELSAFYVFHREAASFCVGLNTAFAANQRTLGWRGGEDRGRRCGEGDYDDCNCEGFHAVLLSGLEGLAEREPRLW